MPWPLAAKIVSGVVPAVLAAAGGGALVGNNMAGSNERQRPAVSRDAADLDACYAELDRTTARLLRAEKRGIDGLGAGRNGKGETCSSGCLVLP